jgi:hypothetical protein
MLIRFSPARNRSGIDRFAKSFSLRKRQKAAQINRVLTGYPSGCTKRGTNEGTATSSGQASKLTSVS